MYQSLPKFVKAGLFCITLPGQKYAYDPFKRYKISARDTFYPFAEILPFAVNGATLGLQVGTAGISAIDIDNCFTTDGTLKAYAADIIAHLNAYTELSPSGNGIRILFKTKTPFDINAFYVKNSALGIEYYDAVHCSGPGARMVRISGTKLIDGENIFADTSYVLEKYMKRPESVGFKTLDEKGYNPERAEVLAYLVGVLPEFYEYNMRMIEHKSESDWDLAYVNMVSAYTDSLKELDYAFKNSRYFRTKDTAHKQKWGKPRYVNGTYERIGADNVGGFLREWLEYFDQYTPLPFEVAAEYLTTVLRGVGIIKTNGGFIPEGYLDPQSIVDALYYCAQNNITAVKWREITINRALTKNKNNV